MLIRSECLAAMREMPDACMDSIVTSQHGNLRWEWQGGPSHPNRASYDEYQDYMSKALSWFANRTISELVDG